MLEVILLSVALINQKCVYSTFDVINAFPSLGDLMAFTGNYLFTFMERYIVRVNCLDQEHNAMILPRACTLDSET